MDTSTANISHSGNVLHLKHFVFVSGTHTVWLNVSLCYANVTEIILTLSSTKCQGRSQHNDSTKYCGRHPHVNLEVRN